MKLVILNELDNKLLGRREFSVAVKNINSTPKRDALQKKFAAEKGVDPSLVIVSKIYTRFGTPEVKADIRIYDNKKLLDEIESKKNKKKLMPKEEKKE